MMSDNSYYVVPQNCNIFSHHEISLYAKTVLKEFLVKTAEDNPRKTKLEQLASEDIRQYEELLANHFITDSDMAVDILEKKRYTAFEVFIDAIDEIQNIWINDPFFVLYSLEVNCEEARFLLPKYEASHKLLTPSGRDDRWGAHYSRAARFGHSWPVDAMEECIEHLRNPMLREHLEITDLSNTAQRLLEADENVQNALRNNDVTLSLESLNKIREWRYRIVNCLAVMYQSIPQCKCSHKKPTIYEAHIIFRDRLIEKKEIELFSVTSLNDLSLSQLFELAKRYECVIDRNPEFFKKLIPVLKENIVPLQCSLDLLKKNKDWSRFEEYEKKLLSTLDMLLCTLSLNLRCIVGAEHEQLWDKHFESDCFKTAESLLEMFDDETYNQIAGFDRGEYITYSFQETILETWKNPVLRRGFEALKCAGLLDDCLLYHQKIVTLNDEITSRISVLREQRIDLCLFLNILESVIKNSEKDTSEKATR